MEGSEWDDEEQYPAAPLPPHERAWRHPSEIGAVQSVRNEPPLALGRGLMVATGAIGSLLAVAVLWAMLPASSDAPSASATVSRLTTQEVVRTTRTTATVRSSISSTIATFSPRSTVASSLASTLAPATSTTSITTAAPAQPTATVHLVASDPAREVSNAVALAGTGMLFTTAKAIGDDRDVQVAMGDRLIAARVVLLDAISGVAVLEPASQSGATPFTVAGCAPGDHVRVLGDTPFDADLSAGDGGHMRLEAEEGWAREGTPVVDRVGHLVGLYSTTVRGRELLRVDRVSGVAPTTTSAPATTSTVAPSSSFAGSSTSEATSTVPTSTLAATTTSTVAPSSTLQAMPVWLGVQADDTPSGLTVTKLAEGGPATAAGMAVGDVITALAGVPVSGRADVADVLAARAPGDTIGVAVLRDGTRLDLSAVLAPRPSL